MSNWLQKSDNLADYYNHVQKIHFLLTLNANTTAASITALSSNPGVRVYVETSGQPTITEDTQTNFGTLDSNAAPATFGVLVQCGNALKYLGYNATVISSASATGLTFTAAGSSSTGVTALLKNIALIGSAAAVDLDANTNVHTFMVTIFYEATNS